MGNPRLNPIYTVPHAKDSRTGDTKYFWKVTRRVGDKTGGLAECPQEVICSPLTPHAKSRLEFYYLDKVKQ